jgi:uncharacterized RDD family membrane protein YckC
MSAPIITVLDENNRPVGPLTIEEIQHGLQTGDFRTEQLAHAPGFAHWTPLHAVLAHVASAQLPTYLLPSTATPLAAEPPPAAARPVPPAPAIARPPAAAAPLPMPEPPSHVPYAGFWIRLVAYVFDSFILSLLTYVPIRLFLHVPHSRSLTYEMRHGIFDTLQRQTFSIDFGLGVFVIAVIFGYCSLLESSASQGTIGKMVVGLRVTDLAGGRISFGHALGRTFLKWFPIALCCLFYFGWLLAAFNPRKQALHDMLAGTLVLWK